MLSLFDPIIRLFDADSEPSAAVARGHHWFDSLTVKLANAPNRHRDSAGRCNWRSWKRLEFVHPASCVLQPPPTECHCKSSGVWGGSNCFR